MDKSFRLGLESEENVYLALRRTRRDGDISWFKRTKRKSKEDMAGIAFMVWYKRLMIPLQVKSSEWYKREHEERYGDSIYCVVGQGPNLLPRIKQALRDYVRKIREQS